jgi:hypothetical protein
MAACGGSPRVAALVVVAWALVLAQGVHAGGGFGVREGADIHLHIAPVQVASSVTADSINTKLTKITQQVAAQARAMDSRLSSLERLVRNALVGTAASASDATASPAATTGKQQVTGHKAAPRATRPSAPITRKGIQDTYLGCAPPKKLPDRTAKEACAAIGLKRTGTRLKSGMPLVEMMHGRQSERDMTNKKRAAICIVGQMRSFPVAFVAWQESLFPLLKTAGTALDLYVITSNSSSFSESAGILSSLPLAGKVVVSEASFLHRPAEDWAWRDRPTTESSMLPGTMLSVLEFNTAKFPEGPGDEAEKRDTYFIQNWQVAKCKEMILRQEAKFEFKYKRVARMRTDVLFHSTHEHIEVKVVAGSCFTDDTAQQCVSATKELHRDQLRKCQRSIDAIESKPVTAKAGWMLPPTFDRGVVGTRDLILNKAFAGLEKLSTTERDSKASWNMERYMPGGLQPDGCRYASPIVRLGRRFDGGFQHRLQDHYSGPLISGLSGRPAVRIANEVPSPRGGHMRLSQAVRDSACTPGRKLHPDIYRLAVDRMARLPAFMDIVTCMEIGSCGANLDGRDDDGCNVGYGETHFKLNAGADTNMSTAAMADWK